MPVPHTGSSCPVVTEPPVHPDMGAMGEQLVKFREDDFPSRKWGHLSDRQRYLFIRITTFCSLKLVDYPSWPGCLFWAGRASSTGLGLHLPQQQSQARPDYHAGPRARLAPESRAGRQGSAAQLGCLLE